MKILEGMDEYDVTSKGKDIDSLKKSRLIRQEFLNKYGFIPSTILKHNRADKAIDPHRDERSYGKVGMKYLKDKGFSYSSSEVTKSFAISATGSRKGALSSFPQNIGRFLVDFFCVQNGLVYDPFAGHNSRMQMVYETGRSYIGVDVSAAFMEHNRMIRDILLKRNAGSLIKSTASIELIEGSSHQVDLDDESADFTITSPPYWDLEYYGDEPEQLGKNSTYESFLESLSQHIKENFRILKPGTFCCWNVNDFVKDGIFHIYHADILPYFSDAGFEIFNILILDMGPPVTEAFVQSFVRSKRLPKRHEYLILLRKQATQKKKSSFRRG